MNKEQTKELIKVMIRRLAVMEAFVQEYPIEFMLRHEDKPRWRSSTDPNWEPAWDWVHSDYRVKDPRP